VGPVERGKVGRQAPDAVGALASPASLVARVRVPARSPGAALPGDAAAGARGRGAGPARAARSAGGLREGRWERGRPGGAVGACAARDDCPLVPGAWRWRAGARGARDLCAGECVACLGRRSWVRFAGDSNCRDIFVEAAACVLQAGPAPRAPRPAPRAPRPAPLRRPRARRSGLVAAAAPCSPRLRAAI